MINMTHHSHDRSTWYQILFIILFFHNSLRNLGAHVFSLIAKFFSHQVDGLSIQTLVDADHDTYAHTGSNDLRHLNVHHVGQLVSRHEFSEFQYLAFFHLQVFLLHHTLRSQLTFFLTILGTFALGLVGKASQGFLYLLGNVFLAYFLLEHRLAEAVLVLLALAVVALIAFALFLTFTLEVAFASSFLDIYLLLADANAFLLTFLFVVAWSAFFLFTIVAANLLDDVFLHLATLALTLFLTFVTLLLSLFLALFLRTGRSVQLVEVHMTHHIQLAYFHVSLQTEDAIALILVVINRFLFYWSWCFNHRSRLNRGFNLLLLWCSCLLLNNGFLCYWCRLNRLWLCNNRLFSWLANFFFHLDFHFHWLCCWFGLSMFGRFVQFVKVYLAYRFELLLSLFWFRFIALNGNSRFHLFLIFFFPSEDELIRLCLQILVGTEFLPEQIKLLIGNLGIGVLFHLISLFPQEFYGGTDTNVQISRYFV